MLIKLRLKIWVVNGKRWYSYIIRFQLLQAWCYAICKFNIIQSPKLRFIQFYSHFWVCIAEIHMITITIHLFIVIQFCCDLSIGKYFHSVLLGHVAICDTALSRWPGEIYTHKMQMSGIFIRSAEPSCLFPS